MIPASTAYSYHKGIPFGYLPQEPALDPDKTVKDLVEEGANEAVSLLKQYEDVSAQFAEPDADYEALMGADAAYQGGRHLERGDIFARLNAD